MNTVEQTFPVVLTSKKGCGKIFTQRKWLVCPACGKQKLFQILPTTRAADLPVWCKKCGAETIVNISTEPEPRA